MECPICQSVYTSNDIVCPFCQADLTIDQNIHASIVQKIVYDFLKDNERKAYELRSLLREAIKDDNNVLKMVQALTDDNRYSLPRKDKALMSEYFQIYFNNYSTNNYSYTEPNVADFLSKIIKKHRENDAD